MRLGQDTRLGVALSILRRIDIPSSKVSVHTYSNCREQGFHIVSHEGHWETRKAVSFSENRNSDDIVVMYGNSNDFDQYGVASEEVYESRKYFAYKDFDGAAKFITKHLRKV